MDTRVYGILGISSIMANWNADFSGFPKTTSDGTVFGSDKAFKYPMKKMWENEGEKVLYIKSYKLSPDKKEERSIVPRSLKERYEQIFQVADLSKEADAKITLQNLFSAIDVKNFGATFAEKPHNISITGAVQFGQGFNKYEDSSTEEQQILSPFRDGTKEEEAKNSTLGTKIVSREAHYFYPFSINPYAYCGYEEMKVTDGYTREDYDRFKKTSIVAATAFSTNAKAGCENELGVFVETRPDVYLPNLSEYVSFEKEEKNIITLSFGDILSGMKDGIISVEIYYNPYTTRICSDIPKAALYNIFTKQEVL